MTMGTCKFCNKTDKLIFRTLSICRTCILTKDWNHVKPHILSVHNKVRQQEELPERPPKATNLNIKLKCNLCINECSLSADDTSYCGLRNFKKNKSGELPLPSKLKGYIHGYLDNNPANCCNVWFCPSGTSAGYPEYSNHNGPEFGFFVKMRLINILQSAIYLMLIF